MGDDLAALEAQKSSKFDALLFNLSSNIEGGAAAARTMAPAARGITATTPDVVEIEGRFYVLVDMISASGGSDTLADDLLDLGALHVEQAGRVVSAYVPVDGLAELNALGSLQSAAASLFQASVGSVTSQDVEALAVDVAQTTYGVTGAGQTIGILSDSFDADTSASTHYADDVASGDLPADVLVLEEIVNTAIATDEGRGMAQLAYDIAPGADIQFASAFNGVASFANNIRALRDAGSTVIVDDVIYFTEPAFADGPVAQAVAEVVADGVPYFSSAGNQANNGYLGPFVDAGIVGYFGSESDTVTTTHDWDPGPGIDPVLDLSLPVGSHTIVVQWSDAYASTGPDSPGAQTDLDVYLAAAGTDPLAAPAITGGVRLGAMESDIGGDPVAVFEVDVTTAGDVGLVIEKVSGVAPEAISVTIYGPGLPLVNAEYSSGGPTSYGHAQAPGAFSVGAAEWINTPAYGTDPAILESFSSLGGIPIYYDTAGNALPSPEMRNNVSFTASDGGNTTFFGAQGSDDDAFPNFFGTSAAAPNAAAIAALMLERDPSLSPAEIGEVLSATALDMNNPYNGPGADPGVDPASGAGLIQADRALAALDGPLIVLDKSAELVPNTPVKGLFGGVFNLFQALSQRDFAVTYAYSLTNESVLPGDAELDFTSIVDDNGTRFRRDDIVLTVDDLISGDTDADGKLDVGETWLFEQTVPKVRLGWFNTVTSEAVAYAADGDDVVRSNVAEASVSRPGFDWFFEGPSMGTGAWMMSNANQGGGFDLMV
ncbi:S8 family serine peptidase [Acuticoccus sp. M5D2P5]|uniref:S8 family peptidase n=1 Tax=Acuticoccus kalidii TaxID=2910977 RepID=UPI001F3724E0|nr:S8 family serine peptidase [Acuticoccus kalidii]MCF3934693.1 S8 family serine peptidase [Acuticoccus kalidii]